MIGVIICCHGDMAQGVLSAAQLIVGPQENIETIALQPGQGQDDLRKALKKAIRKIGKEGAVILTDLPGGTPCNVSAMLINEKIKMIAGFNLPLLIKLVIERQIVDDVNKLVLNAPQSGCQSIIDGDTLLTGEGN